MSETKFPVGWDEDKINKVLAHYDEQSEEQAVVEDEAGIESSETVMNVPHNLVSAVRELIARHQG
ncbi:MAG: hypothetical protein JO033_09055 [Acidobacteriaceae bacterium]|nr:hypothetical protein [Acidobacteriaceae bacterium]MBV9503188.1 hypothetical protein [Acidobacteriaceae bacterium]